jgi:hypothetical protein
LWSVPPAPELWHGLLETLRPSELHLCGKFTTDDTLHGLLRQVGSLCRYALGRDGLLDAARMAARLGVTEAIIRHSLLCLEARGLITIAAWDPADTPTDSIQITPGQPRPVTDEAELLLAELEEQLAEVRAYRRYFLRATPVELGLPPARS